MEGCNYLEWLTEPILVLKKEKNEEPEDLDKR